MRVRNSNQIIRKRDSQQMVWVDKDFIRKMKEINAKRILNGCPDLSLADLTKEITKSPQFNNIEGELINIDIKRLNQLIKTDKRRLL